MGSILHWKVFLFKQNKVKRTFNVTDIRFMAALTTHVLDTANGVPAKGIRIEIFKLHLSNRSKLRETITNNEGRTESPMLNEDQFVPGTYELLFHIGDYFREKNNLAEEPSFLDIVPIRFTIASLNKSYHVPLLASPWGYTTYRGS